MTGSLLADAFAHHVWASVRLLDACLELTPEQLGAPVPGTYGSIRDTARHLVGSDAFYLFRITGDGRYRIDEESMDLRQLRNQIEGHDTAWNQILARGLDPDKVLIGRNDDGTETHAAAGVRIAQVLHHGTDHRSQICTTLTTLGIGPPDIDLWAYGEHTGRVVEVETTT